MKKRFLGVLLSVAMVAAVLAGCGSSGAKETAAPAGSETEAASEAASGETEAAGNTGDVITVGFSQVGAESDWRTANSESMKSTFSTENGYNLIFDDAQQKQENQIAAIRNFIQQEVDYIVLAPVTESGWDTVLQEAKDAEIPVIIVDRMVNVSDDSLYAAWVGSNFKLEGQKACEWLKQYAAAKNMSEVNIVDIQGTIGASAQIGRTEALNEAVEANGWNLLAQQTGEFTQAKGQEVMESFLKSYDDIDVVVCENDNEAFGAIDAIKAAGKTCGPEGDIIVISFDAVSAAFDAMIAGDLNAAFECNPLHGPRVAEIIQKLEAGEEVEKIQYVDEAYFDTSMDLEAIKAERLY